MTSLKSSDDKKKMKRADDSNRIDHRRDESSEVQPPMASRTDESPELISFLAFRRSTINQYQSLNWLGPGVMAVYWFKEFLKHPPFDWVRCPKRNQQSLSISASNHHCHGTSNREKRRKQRQQMNSKGNFHFIPGQYIKIVRPKYKTISTTKDLEIQRILDLGSPGVHYATSYIGVYNMLRRYGKFAIKTEDHPFEKNGVATMEPQAGRLRSEGEESPKVFLFDYNGPPLP
jgi:hypothetical protein